MKRDVSGIARDISTDDEMFSADPDRYFEAGQEVVRLIRLAMLTGGINSLESILDFPCGHGRILRTLRAAFPHARLTACDINRGGVDYCAENFGAVPAYSNESAEVEFSDGFDLIWCGSLLTHLDAPRWPRFLELFESVLRPGGLLIFTTHGRACTRIDFRVPPESLDRARASFEKTGFGYVEYPQVLRDRLGIYDYGLSFSALPWVIERVQALGLGVILASEALWSNQDLIACAKPT